MKYEVHIQRSYGFDATRVYLIKDDEQGHRYNLHHLGEGIIRQEPIEPEGKELVPFMILGQREADLLLPALCSELNRFLGRPDESRLAGTLEATENHLRDLQKLVFKGR